MIQGTATDFLGKGGFILCTKGYAYINTLDKQFRLEEGMTLIATPLVNIVSLTASEDFRYISFLDDVKTFNSIFMMISDTGIPMEVRRQPCWKIGSRLYRFILSQRERIDEKTADPGLSAKERALCMSHCEVIRQETMLEVLMNHFKGRASHSEEQNKQNRIAYRFILNLHENYRTQRTVAWYAREAGLSSGYFADIIRKVSGMSPSRWIATVTISYAKMLLEKTDMSIKEIAAELNFPEQFTFRKYYKQNTGIPPTEYRHLRLFREA